MKHYITNGLVIYVAALAALMTSQTVAMYQIRYHMRDMMADVFHQKQPTKEGVTCGWLGCSDEVDVK